MLEHLVNLVGHPMLGGHRSAMSGLPYLRETGKGSGAARQWRPANFRIRASTSKQARWIKIKTVGT